MASLGATSAGLSGVLVVDKPSGPTSHDVVSWARRVFGTRAVGHAGTLDPLATGVLIILVEEATKLSLWLTSDVKEYTATVRFHVETDSLDSDGTVTQTLTSPPALTHALLAQTLEAMVGVHEQIPPQVSAIKMQGVAAHERVRRGEELVMEGRTVQLVSAELIAYRPESCDCEVHLRCSKGFYVRSFARDFAARLGTIAHLTKLRRTRSGVFGLGASIDGELLRRAAREDPSLRDGVRAKLQSIESLASILPSITVSADDALRLRQGKEIYIEQSLRRDTLLVLQADGGPVGLAHRVDPMIELDGESLDANVSKLTSVRNFAYQPLTKGLPI